MDTKTIAERAQRYQRLCEAYLSLHDAHVQLDVKHTKVQQQFAQLITENRQFKSQAHSQQMALASQLEVLDRRVVELRDHIATQQAIIDQHIIDFDSLQHSHAILQAEHVLVMARVSQLEADNSDLLNELTQLRSQVARLAEVEALNAQLQAALADRDAEIMALKAEMVAKEETLRGLQVQNEWFSAHFDGEVLAKLQESEEIFSLVDEMDHEPIAIEYEEAAAIIASYLEEVRQVSSFPMRHFDSEVEAA